MDKRARYWLMQAVDALDLAQQHLDEATGIDDDVDEAVEEIDLELEDTLRKLRALAQYPAKGGVK